MPPQQQMSEEQMKELQEKIKNMSPEELREFQKKQCIFCQIIAGRVQSKKIFEDDKSLAILDINPSNPGHVLLLPKEHYSIMPQLSEEEITHLFVIAKSISNAALRSLGVQGTNIVVQNGIAAGQKAQHFMVHIIPRKDRDGLNFELPQKKIPETELERIKVELESKLGGVKKTAKKTLPNVQELLKPKDVEAEFEESGSEGVAGGQEEPEENKAAKRTASKIKGKPSVKKKVEKEALKKDSDDRDLDMEPGRDKGESDEDGPSEDGSEGDVSLDDIAGILGVK